MVFVALFESYVYIKGIVLFVPRHGVGHNSRIAVPK